jgi:N-formylglutamate deformylase
MIFDRMTFSSFNLPTPDVVIATAVHNGHDLRPELAALTKLDESTRLREEDPHTGSLASRFASNVVVHRSRFEVDLNRERDLAVYRSPEDAWGLDVWREPLSEEAVAECLGLYDSFYDDLASTLDGLVSNRRGFVLFDIHSYNHRRGGPDADPDPSDSSPVVNLGTGSLPEKWRPVADAFIMSMQAATMDGVALDVRENVRFQGRQVARWVNDKYGEVGCALAIEFKKVFMDEWTGDVDIDRLAELGDALAASLDPVEQAWARV